MEALESDKVMKGKPYVNGIGVLLLLKRFHKTPELLLISEDIRRCLLSRKWASPDRDGTLISHPLSLQNCEQQVMPLLKIYLVCGILL